MVMPANNTGSVVKTLGRLFPASLGLMMSPGGWRNPAPYLPYVLDNGAYSAWTKGVEWDRGPFIKLLDKAMNWHQKPRWIAVPDQVCDPRTTIERWKNWEPLLREECPNIPLAFVVQDGMIRQDVPESADVVFVGGSTEWKWENAHIWRSWFKRVHVGRVNSVEKLLYCDELGIESVDGSGWFQGNPEQTRGLIKYVVGDRSRQIRMFLDDAHEEEDR